MNEFTEILQAIQHGNKQATAALFPLVYHQLRIMAARRLEREQPGQTLDATALVHEAWLRMLPRSSKEDQPEHIQQWRGKREFLAAAAEAMRRILIDNARRKQRLKHGGEWQRVELSDPPALTPDERFLRLDEALTRLSKDFPQTAQVVELRFFAGLSHEDVAEQLEISVYQARQEWRFARAWLHGKIHDTQE